MIDKELFKEVLNKFVTEPEFFDDLVKDSPEIMALMTGSRQQLKYALLFNKKATELQDNRQAEKDINDFYSKMVRDMKKLCEKKGYPIPVVHFVIANQLRTRNFKFFDWIRNVIKQNGIEKCEKARKNGTLLSKSPDPKDALYVYDLIIDNMTEKEVLE